MRAVAPACVANRLSVVFSYYRVVRSDGSLGEYGYGGPQAKRDLLEHEGAARTVRV